MDYLDLRKEARHRIILFTGYMCLTVGIVIGTMILVYRAYGFGLGKNGDVIQNGLTYFSSHPHPASIYVDGKPESVRTNTRLSLPEGIYNISLSRPGYHTWQRTIEVVGGGVRHFDYPFLVPQKLSAKKIGDGYSVSPSLLTQSPDRRWLLIGHGDNLGVFDLYDLKNPTKAAETISLPASVLSKANGSESWQLGEWADDNQHILLQHIFDGKNEFILVDRANPDQSLNLNTTLSVTPTKLSLNNKKYDQYYIYDAASGSLQTASLRSPAVTPLLDHVLAYQTYSNDTVLYVTSAGAASGEVLVKLQTGSRTDTLHSLPAGTTYLVDLTKYSGSLYVALGATSQNKVYIFKDPVGQLSSQPHQALVPAQVLHVVAPNYLSFSTSAQFIVVENGTQFGVYDIEDTLGYSYVAADSPDAPAVHATWMDGDRLTYVSSGKLVEFDYDNTNSQTLLPADSSYLPAFAPDYKYVYNLVPSTSSSTENLMQTPLLTPSDL